MKLQKDQARKADAGLRKALESAADDEVVRAILALATEADAEATAAPAPGDFSDRVAYRKALIARQKHTLQAQTAAVRQALQELSLQVRGGTVLPTVVVEGPARAVAQALALPGIMEGSLDREFRLGAE
jgi:hypothetical protein